MRAEWRSKLISDRARGGSKMKKKGPIRIRLVEDEDRMSRLQERAPNGFLWRWFLKREWCQCGKEEFFCYPDDGECPCGIIKHHVHCTCGGVSQIG